MKVVKFGGTSLADAQQLHKAASIIASDADRRIVVVSAPGKRHRADAKMTDLLIAGWKQVAEGKSPEREREAVIQRFAEIGSSLKLAASDIEEAVTPLRSLPQAVDSLEEPFLLDLWKAAGEDTCARMMACYLRSIGIDAEYVNPGAAGLLVEGDSGNAVVLPESMVSLRSLRDRKRVVVFPGFFGYTPEGRLVTFSRGGSDVTGSILAAAVGAELYENFTDVDSVFAVNPALIPNPKQIAELTYREMRELSYAGFTVLHEEALLPAFRANVPVCIKNTNNPAAPGTRIVSRRAVELSPVVGIANDDGFCSINLTKYLMNREIGFGRKLLQLLEEENVPYEHTPTGIDNFSIIIRESLAGDEVLNRIVYRIREELQVDDVEIVRELALVMIVGEGMLDSVGVVARAANALAKAGVNIAMINQGGSEVSLMFGVRSEDAARAVASLYHEFFYDEVLHWSLLRHKAAL
ncbi:aspartate kinase [Paenibacillus curdlanolyticus YK9]|uniref:Aspartokinase n=1 Tax=Paenibacillus curdlanolyticus YK9 TaxID=717606 RepID=E0IG89_9BACL|nr:aspartate kinase [Paenibacillus curdlanolyticus]EFM08491.1 aspartate kinase [Paenibacillus curdlanolyticus YK9]